MRASLPVFLSAAIRILLGLSLSGTGALASADTTEDPLVFERCTIGDERISLKARCATIAVSADPDDSASGTFDLAVATLPARGRSSVSDPLVFIAGGPGQSAREIYPSVARAFRHANRDRDIILVDQRGTGGSGLLDCPASSDPLGDEEDLEGLAKQARETAIACLESIDVDPALYTTSVAIHDLDAVRQAMGIEQWSLYGVSYGTRVATHYARRFPESTRSLILDAVVPPGTPLGPDIAPLAQRSLSLILARCAADTSCNEAFPDIESRTFSFIEQIEAEPIDVDWEDIASGTLEQSRFTRADLAVSLRLLAYSAHGASLIPSLLHDAIENEHLAPLARQAALQTRSLETSLATGMHYAVVCTEDLPFMDTTQARAAAQSTFLGEAPLVALQAACEAWPAGRIDDDFHSELSLEIPTLVLSGEADPVTPPEYGERVVNMFENAAHIVNPGQGHMQLPLGCMPQVLAEFVQDLEAAAVSRDCLERLRPPPFFVDANGPLP